MTRITSDWEGIVLVTPLGYISRLELSYIFVEGDCYAVLFYPSYDWQFLFYINWISFPLYAKYVRVY